MALEVLEGKEETVNHVVEIDEENRAIFEGCSGMGIALIPTGVYFCVRSATYSRIF